MSWRLTSPKFLKAYWPLNNHARDLSGNGNHGTWGGTEAYDDGPYGKSVAKFDGSSNIDFGTDIWSNVDLVQGTMSTWVSLDNPGASVLQRFFCVKAVLRFLFDEDYADNFQFTLFVGSELNLDMGVSPVANRFYHLVATWDGSTVITYVDAEYASSGSKGSPDLDVSSAKTVIGSNYTGIGADALLGRVGPSRVYDIPLTYDEVIKLNRMDKR